MSLPTDPGDLTPANLTGLLQSGGLPLGQVTDLGWERIGQDRGFGGVCARVTPVYRDAPPDAPATLVLKFPNAPSTGSAYTTRLLADPDRRRQAWERARNEILFYKEIAPAVSLRTPRLWFAAVQEDPPVVLLGLEDIRGARAGDALALGSPAEVEDVLRQIAKLHAAGAHLVRDPRLPQVWRNDPAAAAERFARDGQAFRDRFAGRIPGSVLDLLDAYGPRVERIFTAMLDEPATLIHADLHLDNILFDADGRALIIDWPGIGRGSGLMESSRFLYASLSTPDRRANADRLRTTYLESLARHGGPEFNKHAADRGFRLGLLRWFHVITVWLGSVDPDTYSGRERGFVTQVFDNPFFFDALIDHGGSRLVEEFA